jgi:FMN-dependent NADH-azoreductase
MFQWLYDFFMSYVMPFIASIMSFLGIDSKKSVHFEDVTKGGEQMDAPPTAPVNESA